MSTQFLPCLSQDLVGLLESKKSYDVVVNVDKDDVKKEFYAHSIILEIRSPHFKEQLSKGNARQGNIFIVNIPDISANSFDILIRYIYGGIINFDGKEAVDILNLLVACEILKLRELYDYVQDYLIEHHRVWISQNLYLIQDVSFRSSEFAKLQNYWTKIACDQPKAVFDASNFTSFNKNALLSLYKNEDLGMEENDLWDSIIRWGKAQNSDLSEEIGRWTPSDFDVLRNILEDFMVHMRFYDITSEDFCYKIMPYGTILPKDLYIDLTQYHLVPHWQPKFKNLPSRKVDLKLPLDSKLINNAQAALISSWISGSKEIMLTDELESQHDFQLLTRGSRDGFSGEVFHRLCDGKGPTITIVKLGNETSILGGYNPISWKSSDGNYESTADSFIFHLDNDIILSRVQVHDNAIYQAKQNGPLFSIDFQLVNTFNSANGVYFSKYAYEHIIHNGGAYIADEYEVFAVIPAIKKKQ